MLSQIFKHTPHWVFALFLVLLVYGISQRRARNVTRFRLFVLPAVMLTLSLIGVFTGFGPKPAALLTWAIGVGVVVAAGQRRVRAHESQSVRDGARYAIPGSWVPLALMMTIFVLKYAVGVIHARQLAIAQATPFVWIICLLYGTLSGAFLVRALRVYRKGAA